MHYINLIIIFNLNMIAFPALAEYNKWNGVAFSADRAISNFSQSHDVEKSKVYYSQVGTRVEAGEGVTKTISIVNYKKEKCWFIREKEKSYEQVNLDIDTGECSMPNVSGFKPDLRNPGIFFPKPCYGYTIMKPIGKVYVAGRRASQWECRDKKTGHMTKQWYDPVLRMVVREVKDTGTTIEATNIKLARKPDTALLEPPHNYKRMGKRM